MLKLSHISCRVDNLQEASKKSLKWALKLSGALII